MAAAASATDTKSDSSNKLRHPESSVTTTLVDGKAPEATTVSAAVPVPDEKLTHKYTVLKEICRELCAMLGNMDRLKQKGYCGTCYDTIANCTCCTECDSARVDCKCVRCETCACVLNSFSFACMCCRVCKRAEGKCVCPPCATPGCKGTVGTDDYELEEWLFVGSVCNQCSKSFCKDCIRVCYTCRDEHDKDDMGKWCKLCATGDRVVIAIACTVGHTWKVCKKHSGAACGHCHDNSNYAGKMY